MANPIKINGEEIVVEKNDTVDQHLQRGEQAIAQNDDGSFEVITAEEAKKRSMDGIRSLVVNQRAVRRG